MVKLGPKILWNATSWDEAGKSQVVQILISHQKNQIGSIQFGYAGEAVVHHSPTYGEKNYKKFNTVTFDYPSEFLVSLSGRYSFGSLVSIVFGTNKRKYGPFGSMDTTCKTVYADCFKFNYQFGPKSCFGGFHGSVYEGNVSSIGVHVNPVNSVDELTVQFNI